MAKKRVYELARELKITSKEFIERAKTLGYSWIQSHANTLEDSEARDLKSKIAAGAGLPQPKKKTLLKRRVVQSQGSQGGYKVVTTRVDSSGEKLLESKEIQVSIPSAIPKFTVTETVEPAAPAVEEPGVVETPAPAAPAAPVVPVAPATPVEVKAPEEAAPAAPTPVEEVATPTPAPEAVSLKSPAPEAKPAAEEKPVADPEPAPVAKVKTLPPRVAPQPKKAKVKKKKEPVKPLIELNVNFEDKIPTAPEPAPVAEVAAPAKKPVTIQPHKRTRQPEPVISEQYTPAVRNNDRISRRGPDSNNQRGGGRSNDRGGGRKSHVPNRNPRNTRRGKRPPKRQSNQGPVTAPMSEKKRVVKVDEAITVGDLAHRMGVKANELLKKLLLSGVMATINQPLSVEEATALAKEFNYEVQNVGFQEADMIPAEAETVEDPELMQPRPPVVTVMGHVDHGKTSLLDAIRETDVAASEAGGITQHIGASVVTLKNKGKLVFLDTPGHEAFTSMRSRGAQCTDIVILVVAADDGVMPQTIEAINHAKAADVPIVVAVNKIDKQGANPDNARYALMQHELVPEELGGDIQMFNVSAHTREGLDELLEGVLLLAEMSELQANPDKPASGIVVESHMEKGRGPVATVLVSEGTLNSGDTLVAGTHYGRIRAMYDHRNKKSKEAGPSIPVKVIGLSGTPEPGDRFDIVADEKDAKQIIEHRRLAKQKEDLLKVDRGAGGLIWGENEQKDLNIILKADTQGTLEALRQSLLQLQHDEIQLSIPHGAVGGITENDIKLASTTNSLVFGFHVRADNKARQTAESEGVEIRTFRVIYELIDTVKGIMEKQLAPTLEEKPLGQAEIRKIFNIPKAGRVAGCYVTEGKITRGSLIRLYRDNVQIYEGKVATLRRFKDDVKEVATGFECGIQIEGYQDIRDSDMIEAYEIKEVAQKLEL